MFKEVLERMLERIPNNFDKREGGLLYTALAPFAIEYTHLAMLISSFEANSFADTADREHLIKRARERGLKPFEATRSIIKGTANPKSISLEIGQRFSINDLTFEIIEKQTDFYKLRCEQTGVRGNLSSGKLIPLEYIEGLENIDISEVITPATDDEDTEVFRKRYFDSFKSQAFGGNIADYKAKTKSIDGVGGVVVIPNKDGMLTVKLLILGSDFKKPSQEVIGRVQNIIDPVGTTGQGYGLAPIGHKVSVEPAKETVINITANITYAGGWNSGNAREHIEKAVDEYFKELVMTWEDTEQLIVRISHIEQKLLSLSMIQDIQATQLNGGTNNIILTKHYIPKRGQING